MSYLDDLIDADPRVGATGVPPVMAARYHYQMGDSPSALRILRTYYPPVIADRAWQEISAPPPPLRGELPFGGFVGYTPLAPVLAAGQAAPQTSGFSWGATLLLGGLVAAGLWWTTR